MFFVSSLTLLSQGSPKIVTGSSFIIPGILGENTVYQTPFYVIRSDSEYPKILIDAGMHGDEVAGVYACDSLLKYLEVFEGSVILIPKLNIQAVTANTRGVGIDLNQVFPGNFKGQLYEERLAYDFMSLIKEIDPDIVINLHEAWTRYDQNFYERQKDKSFGQTLITNKDTIPKFLENALRLINEKIPIEANKFHIQVFPYKPNHSMDNIIEKLNTPSFTVETLRTLPMEQRIYYQINCMLTFMDLIGVKYKYNSSY